MRIATAEQIRAIDRAAQRDFGIPEAALMESAGLGGWNALMDHIATTSIAAPGRLVAVAGKGNNGGDALVMARYAHRADWEVSVVLAAQPNTGTLPAFHLASLRKEGVPVVVYTDDAARAVAMIRDAAVVLDGLAGSGISGVLRPPFDEVAAVLSDSGALRVAIDVPSGVGERWNPSQPAVRADLTLAMGPPQRSIFEPATRERCGTLRYVDVGFPEALTADTALSGRLLRWESRHEEGCGVPHMGPGDYKHSRGVVLVLAGNQGTLGAATLASQAAQRSGAGMVHLVVERDLYPTAASGAGAVMVHPRDQWVRSPAAVDSVLVGPGWGAGVGRAILLKQTIAADTRGVLDADALKLLRELGAHDGSLTLSPSWVLTPHVGELAYLLDRSTAEVRERFIESALLCASQWNCVVVAKSYVVVIARADGTFSVVDGMNPALGTAGSGDILAGVIVSLMARGLDAYSAACAGVLVHQEAGRAAYQALGLFAADSLLSFVARYSNEASE